MRRSVLLRGVKVALGSAVAIVLAQALGLQSSATAGIITVLSILGTKRETLRTALDRFLAFLAALLVSAGCFALLGYTLAGFTAYLFVFSVICFAAGWTSALAMVSVLVSHLWSAQTMAPPMLWNETLLLLLGAGCGVAVNLHLHADEARMERLLNAADDRMREALTALSALPVEEEALNAALSSLEEALKAARHQAEINAANRFQDTPDMALSYVRMRTRQREVLLRMRSDLVAAADETPQKAEVCQLLRQVAAEYDMENDVSALLERRDALLCAMKAQALPATRSEFESRALLYSVLVRLEEYLRLKRNYWQERRGAREA